jgi:hypothetical protein
MNIGREDHPIREDSDKTNLLVMLINNSERSINLTNPNHVQISRQADIRSRLNHFKIK